MQNLHAPYILHPQLLRLRQHLASFPRTHTHTHTHTSQEHRSNSGRGASIRSFTRSKSLYHSIPKISSRLPALSTVASLRKEAEIEEEEEEEEEVEEEEEEEEEEVVVVVVVTPRLN